MPPDTFLVSASTKEVLDPSTHQRVISVSPLVHSNSAPMILPEIIFLSPHAYERMNEALLPPKHPLSRPLSDLDAAPPVIRRAIASALKRSVHRVMTRARRASSRSIDRGPVRP
jgi:hypothetical protein